MVTCSLYTLSLICNHISYNNALPLNWNKNLKKRERKKPPPSTQDSIYAYTLITRSLSCKWTKGDKKNLTHDTSTDLGQNRRTWSFKTYMVCVNRGCNYQFWLRAFSKTLLSKSVKLDQTMMSRKFCPKILTKSFKKV